MSINPERIQSGPSAPSMFAVRTSGDLLLLGAIVFVAAVAVGWGGLLMLKTSIHSEVSRINEQRAALTGSRSSDAEEALLAATARADNLDGLLRAHVDGRVAFTLLQDRVQPGVVLRDFSVDYGKGTVRSTLSATSFSAIAQQLLAFQQDARVTGVQATEFLRSNDTGLFSTNIELSLRADVFTAASKP